MLLSSENTKLIIFYYNLKYYNGFSELDVFFNKRSLIYSDNTSKKEF